MNEELKKQGKFWLVSLAVDSFTQFLAGSF
jgi:hypothetical protein